MLMATVANAVVVVKHTGYACCQNLLSCVYHGQIDIIRFFDGFNLRHNGVQIAIAGNFKPTGEVDASPCVIRAQVPISMAHVQIALVLTQAFADFETTDEARRAVAEKDRGTFGERFGDRFVRLVMVSRKEMQDSLSAKKGEGIIKIKVDNDLPQGLQGHALPRFCGPQS